MISFSFLVWNIVAAAVLSLLAIYWSYYNTRWWLRVMRQKTIINKFYKKNVCLEITMPKEVFKSPAAMEMVLLTLNQKLGHQPNNIWPTKDTIDYPNNGGGKVKEKPFWKQMIYMKRVLFEKYLTGGMRMWSSLEIASFEGKIKFYVFTQDKNAEIFKQSLYAQYPGSEVKYVPDYLDKFHYTDKMNKGRYQLYVGNYWKGGKDDLPMKTYIDWELDKTPKEELKIDPLVTLLDWMSAAGKGENYFFQIMIRPSIYNKSDDVSGHPFHWKEEVEKKINDTLGYSIAKEDIPEKGIKKGKVIMERSLLSLSLAEKQDVEIRQRYIQKDPFDCYIRMFYHVDTEVTPFNLNKAVFTCVNALKAFAGAGYANLGFETLTEDLDRPYTDPTGEWTAGKRSWHWKLFKLRAGYYHEAVNIEFDLPSIKMIFKRWFVHKSRVSAMGIWAELKEYWTMPGQLAHRGMSYESILTTEELATLWHFPGKVFNNQEARVSSNKAEPPSNLPF